MSRNVILVAFGGMFGSVFRYLAAFFITQKYPAAFPLGTFSVNIAGCFLIGLFYGFADRYNWFSPDMRLFLTTGFCGGFTTFSSFAYENIQVLQDRDFVTFVLYSASSFVFGLLAVFVALSLVRVS